jgi:hypothetical protein
MVRFSYWYILFLIYLVACTPEPTDTSADSNDSDTENELQERQYQLSEMAIGALLLTGYKSLEDLKKDISIDYRVEPFSQAKGFFSTPEVRLTHQFAGEKIISVLRSGVSEGDFNRARDGYLWDRVILALKTPFAVINKNDLVRIELLGRRRYEMFGEGDIAFYDLAEQMVKNIRKDTTNVFSERDFSEKGYLNTFNHITAQALMTAAYSEKLADFVADVHERYTMPELITGEFTSEQLADLEKGPVDNYVDMVNNEWGQKLGKQLRLKYEINDQTQWTATLLANLLNDIQRQCGFALNLRFKPFREEDEMMIRFVDKLNKINTNVSKYIQYYFDRVKLSMDC